MYKYLSVATSLFCLLIIGCAPQSSISKLGEQDYYVEEDEKKIWEECNEIEQKLDNSGFVYKDSAVTKYLNDVLYRILPQGVKGSKIRFQVVIIKNPLLNAFAFPNGKIYVHTGILAKIENEAQLATLLGQLGHEVNHVVCRHTLKQIRSIKSTRNILAFVEVFTIPFGFYGSLVGLLGNIGAIAAITGYSRDMEREADRRGFEYIITAGYEPKEAPKLFEHLKKDVEEEGIEEPFFFGSHQKLKDRIESYSELLSSKYKDFSGIINSVNYDSLMKQIVFDNAELDIQAGRMGSAEKCAHRVLKIDTLCAHAYYLCGEIQRRKGTIECHKQAIDYYKKAIDCDSLHSLSYRGMGLVYLKTGDKASAKINFEKYLLLSPEAADVKYIQNYIKEIESGEE